jgi:hypothetical protein
MPAGLARFAVRRGRLVLAGTLVVAVVVVGVLGSGGFSDPNAPPNRGTTPLGESFDVGDPDLLVLLITKAGSVGDPAMAAAGSPLVCPTDLARTTRTATDRRQATWVNRLAGGIGRADLESTARVLEQLCHRLEADSTQDPTAAREQEAGMGRPPEPVERIPSPVGRGRSKR